MVFTYTHNKKKGVIEKHGFVPTFTLDEVKESIESHQKTLRELVANAAYHEAKIKNIEDNHGKAIAKLTDEQQFAVHMYMEAKIKLGELYPKVKAFKKQIKEDEAEVKEILKQIPELNDTK